MSRCAKPKASATARPIVPLPAAAGPSIATVNAIPQPGRQGCGCVWRKLSRAASRSTSASSPSCSHQAGPPRASDQRSRHATATPGSVTPSRSAAAGRRSTRGRSRTGRGCAPPDRSRCGSPGRARDPPSAGRAPRRARPRLQRGQEQLPLALGRIGRRRRPGERPQPLEDHQGREQPLVAERQRRHLAERVQLEEPVRRRERRLGLARPAAATRAPAPGPCGRRATPGNRPADRCSPSPRPLRRHRRLAPILAPSPRISSTKPGKLVAIVAASSTAIGRRAASPRQRNDMAMRWSSRLATVAPPGTPARPAAVHDQVVAALPRP